VQVFKACVLTEQGTATFGYNAKAAGVGGGHEREANKRDGSCVKVVGPECCDPEQHLSDTES
jgi:hypothetical protein